MNDVAMHPLVTDTDNSRLRGLMETPLARHHGEMMRLLASKLARARIVPAVRIPGSVVTMNSRAACWDESTGASQELALVYPWNVAGLGQVSVLSRAGIELLAAVPGQLVRLGESTLKIAFVSYQPEAERQFFL